MNQQEKHDVDRGRAWLISIGAGIIMRPCLASYGTAIKHYFAGLGPMLLAGIKSLCTVFINKLVGTAPLTLFGAIFRERIEELDIGTEGVATIITVFVSTHCISGIFFEKMMNHFPMRPLCISAAALLFLGNLASNFCETYPMLIFSYGFISGLGFGILIFAAVAVFNDHFERRRAVGAALVHTVNMAGSMLYPKIVTALLSSYGYFGTQMAIAALSANAFPMALLMRTPRDVFKKRKSNLLLEAGKQHTMFDKVDSATKPTITSKSVFRKWFFKLRSIKHVQLMMQPSSLSIAIGLSVVSAADSTFFAIHILYLLEHLAFTIDQTSTILTVTAAGDFTARFLLMLTGQYILHSKRVFWTGGFGTAVGVMVLSFVSNYVVVTIVSALLGLFRGVLMVTMLLVVAESCNAEAFRVYYATVMAMTCAANLALGPIIGKIRDNTQSYVLTFSFISILIFACSFMWLLEEVWKYIRKDNTRLKQYAAVQT